MRVRLDAEPHHRLLSLEWQMGKALQDVPRISATVSTQDLPDHVTIGSIEYVSLKVKEVLEKAGAEAEFFRLAELKTRRGRIITAPYFAMNILRRVDCFDYERSDFTRYSAAAGGGVLKILRLSILEDRLANSPLATMKSFGLCLLRRDIVDVMRSAGIRGCYWIEVEAFSEPMKDLPKES